jgi:solute:Na+ symporter, SSS family
MRVSLTIIFIFLALALYLGIRARKGKQMNLEQWTVGGRGFGTLFAFLLIAGEVYTTFTFLGGSGWAYSKGAAAYYVPTYIFLAYVLSYLYAPKIWKYSKENNIISHPDFFAKKYKSRPLGLLVAIVGSIALVPYIVIQLKGLGIIVSEASYGAISPVAASCLGAIVVTIYVMISGIHGSAWTAVIKDFMILAVVVFIGIYIPVHYFGGVHSLFKAVQTVKPDFLTLPDKGLSYSWFISTVLLNTIGFYLFPHSFMVILTAKSEKTIRKNAITLPLYTLLLLFIFFIGFSAFVKIPGLKGASGDLSLLKLSIQTFSPWVIGLIGGAGVLTALVPTSVMLMSGAAGLTQNLYRLVVPSATEKQLSIVSKLLIIFLSAIALYLTITGGEALAMFNIISYGLIIQLAPALFFSLKKNNFVNKYGALAGIITGELVALYLSIANVTMSTLLPNAPQWFKDINGGFIALMINVIIMSVVSLITKKMTIEIEELHEVKNSSY